MVSGEMLNGDVIVKMMWMCVMLVFWVSGVSVIVGVIVVEELWVILLWLEGVLGLCVDVVVE